MTKPDDDATGDCFEAAATLILSPFFDTFEREPQVCHGYVTGQGRLEGQRFVHAWVEAGALVYDFSNGRRGIFPAADYYKAGQIDPSGIKRYTPDETRKWMLRAGHYGPWELD